MPLRLPDETIAFEPYGRRRSGGRMPRWLLLLLIGLAAGAGGLFFVQERYLPPRLSAGESAELRSAYESADAARTRLTAELADATKRLDAALADRKKLSDDLSASRKLVEGLRGDIAAVVASLPPDPRGGAVEIRAARFATNGTTLGYDVLLTRDRTAAKPLDGSLQLTVAGQSAKGVPVSFRPPAEPVSIAGHEMARGNVTLPEGLRADQVTVQVLDRAGGRPLGMRVMLVK